VFTLIHELAHAVVARAAGAEASISLEFMAGFTAYHAPHQLPRRWTLAISLAGPLTHIAAGAGAVLALGGSPFHAPGYFTDPKVAAISWAGIGIGLFNLIPVLPLDGGHATATLLDRVIPGRAETVMLYFSVAVTLGVLAASPFVDRLQGTTLFVGFVLILQLSALFDHRRRHAVSPFDAAVGAVRNGKYDRAVAVLTRGLSRPSTARLVPTVLHGGSDDELRTLLAHLPRPLPAGDPWHEYLLSTILVRLGQAREAAEYSAACYAAEPNPLAACGVARAAAALGDGNTAVAWLRAARDIGTPDEQLRVLVMGDPAFAAIRGRPDLQQLVGAQGFGPPGFGGPGTAPTAEPRRT
jgi:Zn-dependent protease